MRPKDYKHIPYPQHPIKRFAKYKQYITGRGGIAATPVGDKTIINWMTTPTTLRTVIGHYVWLKYKYEVEVNKRKRWTEEVRELKDRIKELEQVSSTIEKKLRTKLVFNELPEPISKEIDKLMIKAYIDGKVKI